MSTSAKLLTALMRSMRELHRHPESKERIVVQAGDDALLWRVEFVYPASEKTHGKEYRVECNVGFSSCVEGQPPHLGIVRPRLVAPFIHHGAICLVDFGMTRFDPVVEPEQIVMLLEELHFRLSPESVAPPTGDSTSYAATEHENGFEHIRNVHPHFARQLSYHDDDDDDARDGAEAATPIVMARSDPSVPVNSIPRDDDVTPTATTIVGNDWTRVADDLFGPSALYTKHQTVEADVTVPASLQALADLLAEIPVSHAIEGAPQVLLVKLRMSRAPKRMKGSIVAPVLVIGARKRVVLCPADSGDDAQQDVPDRATENEACRKPLLALNIQVGDGSDIAISGFTLTGSLDLHGLGARGYMTNCRLVTFSLAVPGSHASCDVKHCTLSPSCSVSALRDATIRLEDCGMLMDADRVDNAAHNALAAAASFPGFFFADGERARLAMNRCTLQSPAAQSAMIVLLNGAQGLVRATTIVTRSSALDYKSSAILVMNSKLTISESSITTSGCVAVQASFESDVSIHKCQCESLGPRDEEHRVSGITITARSKGLVTDTVVKNYFFAFLASEASTAQFVTCEVILANNGFTAEESSIHLERCRMVNARQVAVFANSKSFASVENCQVTTQRHGFECANHSRMIVQHCTLHASGADTVAIYAREHADVKITDVTLTCSVLPNAYGICVNDEATCTAADVTISDFGYAVSSHDKGRVELSNVTIERARNGVTLNAGCAAIVDNSRILGGYQVAFFVTGDAATAKITGSILRTGKHGIECANGAKATVEGVTVECTGTEGNAFFCRDKSEITVKESCVKGCNGGSTLRGASTEAGGTFFASNLTVSDVDIGAISMGKSAMELRTCTFSRVKQGISVAESKATVVNCTVHGATQVGVFCNHNSNVIVETATISTRCYGVEVSAASECVASDVTITNVEDKGTGFCAREKSKLTIAGTSSVRCDGQADGVAAESGSIVRATGLLITATAFAAAARTGSELFLDRCRIDGCANGVTLTDGSEGMIHGIFIDKATTVGVLAHTNAVITLRSRDEGATRTRVSSSRYCLETDNTAAIDCRDADLELSRILVTNVSEATAVVFRSSRSTLEGCRIRNTEPWAVHSLEGCGVRVIDAAPSLSDCEISDFAIGVHIRNDDGKHPFHVTMARVHAVNVDDAFSVSGRCHCTLRCCSACEVYGAAIKAVNKSICEVTRGEEEGGISASSSLVENAFESYFAICVADNSQVSFDGATATLLQLHRNYVRASDHQRVVFTSRDGGRVLASTCSIESRVIGSDRCDMTDGQSSSNGDSSNQECIEEPAQLARTAGQDASVAVSNARVSGPFEIYAEALGKSNIAFDRVVVVGSPPQKSRISVSDFGVIDVADSDFRLCRGMNAVAGRKGTLVLRASSVFEDVEVTTNGGKDKGKVFRGDMKAANDRERKLIVDLWQRAVAPLVPLPPPPVQKWEMKKGPKGAESIERKK
jgi:hypothetical protein